MFRTLYQSLALYVLTLLALSHAADPQLSSADCSVPEVYELGSQHWENGNHVSVAEYTSTVQSATPPFNQFYGADNSTAPDNLFDVSWTFSTQALKSSLTAAQVTIGFLDIDADKDMIPSCTIAGVNCSAVLSAALPESASKDNTYSLVTFKVPVFEKLTDAINSKTVDVHISFTRGSNAQGNGVAMDFARFSVSQCPYSWYIGEWSGCDRSESCLDRHKYRTVQCRSQKGVVDASFCAAAGSKPSSAEPCACDSWVLVHQEALIIVSCIAATGAGALVLYFTCRKWRQRPLRQITKGDLVLQHIKPFVATETLVKNYPRTASSMMQTRLSRQRGDSFRNIVIQSVNEGEPFDDHSETWQETHHNPGLPAGLPSVTSICASEITQASYQVELGETDTLVSENGEGSDMYSTSPYTPREPTSPRYLLDTRASSTRLLEMPPAEMP